MTASAFEDVVPRSDVEALDRASLAFGRPAHQLDRRAVRITEGHTFKAFAGWRNGFIRANDRANMIGR